MKNVLFFIITTLVIISLNLFPLISHVKHAPPGRSFALIHNNVQDFFFYQALMNEGANGSWLTYDPYTTESGQPSMIFSYFLYLGKLSKIFNVSYAVTYHLSRIILGILFLLSAYYLLHTAFPKSKLTFLLFLFASPFMNGDKPYMNWWTGMDAIRRVAYLPHHMAGSLLLVITIILLIKKRYLFAIAIAPILAFVHTPSLFILLLILLPTVLICQVTNVLKSGDAKQTGDTIWGTPNKRALRPQSQGALAGGKSGQDPFASLFIYWIIGMLFMFLMISQTRSGFPWSQYIDWEKNLQFPLNRELIGALGILFPFSIIGAVSAVRSRKFINILIACWLFIPILMIPFAQKLNISNIRLIQGAPYLPMAILASLGITTLRDLLTKKISSLNSKHETRNSKQYQNTNDRNSKCFEHLNFGYLNLFRISDFGFRISTVLLFIIFTYPTIKWSLNDQIREYWPIYGNVYLDDRLNNAFSFINQNFPSKTNTLSTFYTGNYLPAFTKTVSFIGHFGYTYNMKEKEQLARTFLENNMTDEQAIEFLKNNKITLIFQGSEEKPIYNDKLYPKLLKPVYDRDEVTLYILRTDR